MTIKTKVDLRFNDVKHAVVEVAAALKNCPLNDEALAVLISHASGSRGVSKGQVAEVLKQIHRLERVYLKEQK